MLIEGTIKKRTEIENGGKRRKEEEEEEKKKKNKNKKKKKVYGIYSIAEEARK